VDRYENQRFVLRINVSVQQTDQHGNFMGNQLEINDRTHLKCSSFLEVAKVLGKFHELSEVIKKEADATDA
jgi:hypothetical protein